MKLESIGDLSWPNRLKPVIQPDESTCGVVMTYLFLKSIMLEIPQDELIGMLGNTFWGTEISNIEAVFRLPKIRSRVVFSTNNSISDLARELDKGKLVMYISQAEWAKKIDQKELNAGHNSLAYGIDKWMRLCGYDSGCQDTRGLHKFPIKNLMSIWVERDLLQGIVHGWMAYAR